MALKCFKDLPPFGNHLMKASAWLEQGLFKTGEANLVSVVTLKYRIFDSFAEAAILFVAVIAVLVILRPKGKKHD